MDENSKKSNVVLLTVIAIVTMLVVVIGATFAYLASQVDGKGNSNINVTTNVSSDLFLIDAGAPIEIVANTENFGKDQAAAGEDLSAESLGSITFTTNSDTESKRKYKIDFLHIIIFKYIYFIYVQRRNNGWIYKILPFRNKRICGK